MAPWCQVEEEKHVGRVGVASLLFVKSWPCSDAQKVLREYRCHCFVFLNLSNFSLAP